MKKILILGQDDMLPGREFPSSSLQDYSLGRDVLVSDMILLDFGETYFVAKDRDGISGRCIVKQNNRMQYPLEFIE